LGKLCRPRQFQCQWEYFIKFFSIKVLTIELSDLNIKAYSLSGAHLLAGWLDGWAKQNTGAKHDDKIVDTFSSRTLIKLKVLTPLRAALLLLLPFVPVSLLGPFAGPPSVGPLGLRCCCLCCCLAAPCCRFGARSGPVRSGPVLCGALLGLLWCGPRGLVPCFGALCWPLSLSLALSGGGVSFSLTFQILKFL
jgi:hypothetical protein